MNPIRHDISEETSVAFLANMETFRPGHMIALLGPSGVGKSTLRRVCMRDFFGRADKWGLGRIPVIEVYPSLSSNAFFNSRHLADTMLDNVNVPDLSWLGEPADASGWHADLLASIRDASGRWQRLKNTQLTEKKVWDSFKASGKLRSLLYVSLEQVTSLMVNRKNTEPSTHLLNLMNIGEEMKIMFILTGVTKAFQMWGTHPEMRRRIHPVWMGNYSKHIRGDELKFMRLLKTVGENWNLARKALLVEMAAEIMAATAGVIGEVEMLLERASVRARVDGSPTIRKEHLEACYYNQIDLDNLWRDVDEFWEVSRSADVSEAAKTIRSLWSKQRSDSQPAA